jgi:HlyD family secretion protein
MRLWEELLQARTLFTMRKWIVRILVVLVIVAAIAGLRATVWAPKPLPVKTLAVERGRVEATITNSKSGTIRARRRAKLSPGTSGTVLEVLVERGGRVAKGDLILRLEDTTQSAAFDLAEKALAVSEAMHSKSCIAAERTERELQRNKELADSIVSKDVIDRLESAHRMAQAECDVAATEVEHARSAVDAARAELEKTRLYAPFDAIIAEKTVEVGEWVTPSVPLLAAPDLFDAIDPSSLYVSAPMDEVDAEKLTVGQRVRVTIDPFPDQSFEGHVARVAPYVLDLEKQNRTIEVEVELEDQEFSRSLLPGTSADVEVILEVKESVLRIPTSSLLEGSRVLVVQAEMLVERAVTIGIKNWNWVEILTGLSEGDRIVTSLDQEEVKAGARVVTEPAEASP